MVVSVLIAAVPSRNWYWAYNERCLELPEANISIMGYALLPSQDVVVSPSLTGDTWTLVADSVPYGDWFAIASGGSLAGGASRCDGKYVYGSTQGGELTLSLTREHALQNLTVALVHGNGYAQTYVATVYLAGDSPARPPSPSPPPTPPTIAYLPPPSLPTAAAASPSPPVAAVSPAAPVVPPPRRATDVAADVAAHEGAQQTWQLGLAAGVGVAACILVLVAASRKRCRERCLRRRPGSRGRAAPCSAVPLGSLEASLELKMAPSACTSTNDVVTST